MLLLLVSPELYSQTKSSCNESNSSQQAVFSFVGVLCSAEAGNQLQELITK